MVAEGLSQILVLGQDSVLKLDFIPLSGETRVEAESRFYRSYRWNDLVGSEHGTVTFNRVPYCSTCMLVSLEIVPFVDLALELMQFTRSHDEIADYPGNHESQKGKRIGK